MSGASYLFVLNSDRDVTELPEEIREKTDYHFRKLTTEHMTKLILLQKMKMDDKVKQYSPIFICWDSDVELDDFQEDLHPKLFNIIKYTSGSYGIFHRYISELTETDRSLIKEQKNYNNK
jgi:hypothetical protein